MSASSNSVQTSSFGEGVPLADASPIRPFSPQSPASDGARKRPHEESYASFASEHPDHSNMPDGEDPTQSTTIDENPAGRKSGGNGGQRETPRPQQQGRSNSVDLMSPVRPYNWNSFKSKTQAKLSSVGTEEEMLRAEYKKWEWMHEIWSKSRADSEKERISRELATIARWTQLKEKELEKAREEHAQSIRAISQVLGIVPNQ